MSDPDEPHAPPSAALPRGLALLRSAALGLGVTCLALLLVDWFVMPVWGERAGGVGSPVPRARELLTDARAVTWFAWLASLVAFWAALFHYAARAGGAAYATGHLALSMLLTPVIFTGLAVIPLIVAREVADGTAEHRRRSMRFGWLDVVFVAGGVAVLWYFS